jgi:hypothetical protein
LIIEDGACFPKRWLANGDPYEFSSTPRIEAGVSAELVECYSTLKHQGEKDLSDLLGLYCVHNSDYDAESSDSESGDIVWVEKTKGRRNIVEPVRREDAFKIPNFTPASWHIGSKQSASEKFIVSNLCKEICLPTEDGHEGRHTK